MWSREVKTANRLFHSLLGHPHERLGPPHPNASRCQCSILYGGQRGALRRVVNQSLERTGFAAKRNPSKVLSEMSILDPLRPGQRLALGAVAIPAAIEGVTFIAALIAVTTRRCAIGIDAPCCCR
jgi:hypothetical protein